MIENRAGNRKQNHIVDRDIRITQLLAHSLHFRTESKQLGSIKVCRHRELCHSGERIVHILCNHLPDAAVLDDFKFFLFCGCCFFCRNRCLAAVCCESCDIPFNYPAFCSGRRSIMPVNSGTLRCCFCSGRGKTALSVPALLGSRHCRRYRCGNSRLFLCCRRSCCRCRGACRAFKSFTWFSDYADGCFNRYIVAFRGKNAEYGSGCF